MKRYKDEISMMEKINEQNRKEKLSKLPKPFLLKRVWAGLLDIIFIVILTFNPKKGVHNGQKNANH